MKKIKLLFLLLLTTVTFYFGIGKVMALPVCDMKNNYGDVEIVYRNLNFGDLNYFNNRISYWCYDVLGGPTVLGYAAKNDCEKPEQYFSIQFNVSTFVESNKGYVEKAKFTIYNNQNQPQCYIEYKPTIHSSVYQYNFHLTKKEVKYITAEGSYYDGNKSVSFEQNEKYEIGYKGDGSGNVHTTSTAKPNETTTTTTLKQNDINTTKDNGAAAGIETGKSKTVNTDFSHSNQNSCTNVSKLIRKYWKYVIALTPILLIVVMVLDFFKAVTSNDADAIKKASSNAVKRTISLIILLALPNLLIYIFELFGITICI